MSKFEKSMDQILDVTPKVIESTPVASVPAVVSEKPISDDIQKDYEQSRENLQKIIAKGQLAIDDILAIARDTEHPRAFEVAATMLKNVVDANKELLAIQKQLRDLRGENKKAEVSVDKAIFVGTTADLLKMVRSKDD